MKETRYFVQNITLADGAGSSDVSVSIPSDYKVVVAVALHEIANPNAKTYNVGIMEGSTYLHEPVTSQNWLTNENVEPDRKFKTAGWVVRDQHNWKVTVSFAGNLTGGLQLQMVFILSKN